MKSYFIDFINLFFPDVCAGCRSGLLQGEKLLCVTCHLVLPRTGFHLRNDNEAMRRLYGRTRLESVASLWYFNKHSRVQRLVHEFKYNGHTDIGVMAGKMLGQELLATPGFSPIDAIIPVPLHPSKLLKRGYNQSEYFGAGLSDTLRVPMIPDVLKRISKGESQTRKRRTGRGQSVEGAFQAVADKIVPGHLLLVDDVMTTGATLVSCASPLLNFPGVKLSVATMAYARR